MLSPVASAVSYVVTPFQNFGTFIREISTLKTENNALKDENLKLRSEMATERLASAENEELRELLQYKPQAPGKLVVAGVIGRSSVQYFSEITVNKGSRSGVREDLAVISGGALVGKVVQVTPTTSKVQLIIDDQSGVSVSLLGSSDAAVVSGENLRELRARYIRKESTVRPGDTVVTSGLGGVYPAGLLVGTVARVIDRPFDLYKTAVVVSPVEFDRMRTLAIVVVPET